MVKEGQDGREAGVAVEGHPEGPQRRGVLHADYAVPGAARGQVAGTGARVHSVSLCYFLQLHVNLFLEKVQLNVSLKNYLSVEKDKAFIFNCLLYPGMASLVIRIRQGAVSILTLPFVFIEVMLGNFVHINTSERSFIIAI